MTLVLDRVTKSFGGLRAVDSVSMTVPRGAVLGLIGPNGAGKSTLVGCLSGALRADSGRATWDGTDLVGRSPESIVRAGVVRTFQHARLLPGETVLGNVLVGAHSTGRSGFLSAALRLAPVRRDERAMQSDARDALDAVGCAHLADRPASELTAGQQRLVALARAVAGRPRLLLLDEPAAGLNDAETAALEANLRALRADRDLTVVVIEHHLGFVMSISSQVVVLSQGRVIADGTPAEVSASPEVVSAYTGAGPC
ncbi:MAG: ABC transporter ATP-binding protein [Acidimicrobiia bacterium]